jgi:hypothetical protein
LNARTYSGDKGAVKKRPKGTSAAELLQYKVVELSTVDEGTLEEAVNAWTRQGWSLEGVQFAMRESSKRPAMAFVFFTRLGQAAVSDPAEARGRLHRLATGAGEPRLRPVSALERLAELAEDEPGEPE